MIKALNTAATGMASQEANVNNISNNIANSNTTGFKKSRTEFEDLLYETVQEPGARSSDSTRYNVGIQVGTGSKVSANKKIHTQGNPMITNNPFDLLIKGEGFFGILTPNNQVKYTRDGSFSVDAQGNLVTKNGDKLFPGITLPANTLNVNISDNGTVEAYFKNNPEPEQVGNIPLFTFINPAGLKSVGANLYSNTMASGEPTQNVPGENNSGGLMQGALESSNVSVMNEMTSLIKAQRAYEMNSKIMTVADQMLQSVNNIR